MFQEWKEIRKINFEFGTITRGRATTNVCKNIMTFDIETTTAMVNPQGKAIPITKHQLVTASEIYKDCSPYSIMYIWQIAISDGDEIRSFCGRTYEELSDFINQLSYEINLSCKYGKYKDDCRGSKADLQMEAVIYIHNMPYEFQFLLNIFKDDFGRVHHYKGKSKGSTFARTQRKPMKTDLIRNRVKFHIRDSYVLTNLNLDAWCETRQLPVKKLTGTIDYLKIRTPITPLTEAELAYCEHDVVAMVHGIRQYVEQYETLTNIPMTQTGEVRRSCVTQIALKDPDWSKECAKITTNYTYEDFLRLKTAYSGGWTHANARYVGKVLYGLKAFDFASSYPAVMTYATYPIGEFFKASEEEWDMLFNQDIFSPTLKYHYYVEFECDVIRPLTQNTFWSASKVGWADEEPLATAYNVTAKDNGKIISGHGLHLTLTDLDFHRFKEVYELDNIKIRNVYKSRSGFLPRVMINLLLDYYEKKTKLKGVEPTMYIISKQFINSIYGVCVTKIADDDVYFTEDGWVCEPLNVEKFNERTDMSRKTDTQYVTYQLGVWVTAWARHNLWDAIYALDDNVVYCDTDSVKGFFGDKELQWFDDYNKKIIAKCHYVAEHYNLPKDLWAPTTVKGKKKPLGIFAREDDYEEFKTLGAKRYVGLIDYENPSDSLQAELKNFIRNAYRDKNKVLHIQALSVTVAGLPKTAGQYIESVESFESGLTFNEEQSDKLISYYFDDAPDIEWVDYLGNVYHSSDRYGIALVPTTCGVTYGVDFEAFINLVRGIDDGKINYNHEMLSRLPSEIKKVKNNRKK